MSVDHGHLQKIMKRLIKRYVLKAQVDRESDEVNEGKKISFLLSPHLLKRQFHPSHYMMLLLEVKKTKFSYVLDYIHTAGKSRQNLIFFCQNDICILFFSEQGVFYRGPKLDLYSMFFKVTSVLTILLYCMRQQRVRNKYNVKQWKKQTHRHHRRNYQSVTLKGQ